MCKIWYVKSINLPSPFRASPLAKPSFLRMPLARPVQAHEKSHRKGSPIDDSGTLAPVLAGLGHSLPGSVLQNISPVLIDVIPYSLQLCWVPADICNVTLISACGCLV